MKMIAVSFEPRMLAQHRCQLEAVEFRHTDVNQHDPNIVLQKKLQGFACRRRLDQVLVEFTQDDLIG